MFDDLAKDMAAVQSGIFGQSVTYRRGNTYKFTTTAVLRRDAETVDDNGQVVLIEYVISIAHSDINITPKRGDEVIFDCEQYTLGKRLSDNGYRYEFEATR